MFIQLTQWLICILTCEIHLNLKRDPTIVAIFCTIPCLTREIRVIVNNNINIVRDFAHQHSNIENGSVNKKTKKKHKINVLETLFQWEIARKMPEKDTPVRGDAVNGRIDWKSHAEGCRRDQHRKYTVEDMWPDNKRE